MSSFRWRAHPESRYCDPRAGSGHSAVRPPRATAHRLRAVGGGDHATHPGGRLPMSGQGPGRSVGALAAWHRPNSSKRAKRTRPCCRPSGRPTRPVSSKRGRPISSLAGGSRRPIRNRSGWRARRRRSGRGPSVKHHGGPPGAISRYGFQTGGLLGGARAGATALGDMVGISAGAVAGIAALGASLLVVITNAAQTAAQNAQSPESFYRCHGSMAAGAVESSSRQSARQPSRGLYHRPGHVVCQIHRRSAWDDLEGEKAVPGFREYHAGISADGSPREQTTRALSAVQQAISKGTPSAEELRSSRARPSPQVFD